MPDIITLTGLVATNPRHIMTTEGLSITSFRLASSQRRFDRSQERWVDAETNWYTITSFRRLALNCSTSILKGQRVLVTGKLRIREWDTGDRVGTTIDIEAESIGHDLSWGTSTFSRTIMSTAAPEQQFAPDSENSEAADDDPDATDLREPEREAGSEREPEADLVAEFEPTLVEESLPF